MEKQYFNKLTANNIKNNLEEKFEELKEISKSTITRWLKKDLGCSYKKIEKKPEPALNNETLRKLMEVDLIQKQLYAQNIEVIYIDEFSINTRHHKFHGWAKRGSKGFLRIQSKEFNMTFIWAVSNLNVYGLMGCEGTITSNEIKLYIRQLAISRSSDQSFKNIGFIWCMTTLKSIHVKQYVNFSKNFS